MDAKRQHYVPKGYLKQFASDGKKIWVFDKPSRSKFASNISNIASETYFYDIPEELGIKHDRKVIERELSEIENELPRAIRQILHYTKTKERVTLKQKEEMSFFMAIQLLRTPTFRNQYIEIVEKGFQAVVDGMAASGVPGVNIGDRVAFDRKLASIKQAQFMFNPNILSNFISVLYNHIWLIGINNTNTPLYTSDHPVVRVPHKADPIQPYTGLASEGIEIAFPLTPKCILLLYERSFFAHLKRRDRRKQDLSPNHVKYYNALQVIHSNRQVYSLSSDFKLADEICEERPEVCLPNRESIEIYTGSRPE